MLRRLEVISILTKKDSKRHRHRHRHRYRIEPRRQNTEKRKDIDTGKEHRDGDREVITQRIEQRIEQIQRHKEDK